MRLLRGEFMRHTTTHTVPCPHGERTDRTTSTGEPLCPLCRYEARRNAELPDPQPDWQTLRAADDTLNDDPRYNLQDGFAASDAAILEALFADDSRGRRLRHRIRAAL